MPSPIHRYEQANFFEAITGLIFEPRAMSAVLLEKEDPPYVVSMFFTLLLTIFIPILSQRFKYGIEFATAEAGLGILVVVLGSLFLFIILEALFLLLVGVQFNLRHLIAVVSYCIAPLNFSIWILYLFNFIYDKNLSIITYIMTGTASVDPRFLSVLPYALMIVSLLVYLVFFWSLKVAAQLFTFTAILLSLLSIIPWSISFLLSLFMADLIRPGTIDIFLSLMGT